MSMLRAIVLLLVMALPATSQDDPIGKDRHDLQGTWKVTKLMSRGIERPLDGALVVFKDATMTLTRAGQSRGLGLVYALRPSTTPKEIDFIPAPEPGKETPALPGIYEFTETGLRLCVAQGDPARLTRPKQFASQSGSTHLFLTLERVKGN